MNLRMLSSLNCLGFHWMIIRGVWTRRPSEGSSHSPIEMGRSTSPVFETTVGRKSVEGRLRSCSRQSTPIV